MGMCKGCGEVYSAIYMINGYCENCIPENEKISYENEENLKKERENLEKERENLLKEKIRNLKTDKTILDKEVIFTTEAFISEIIENRIQFISTQRVYGINLIKDIFSFVRDIVGGRINSLENALDEATKSIEKEFKEKAYLNGGNAVIGVKIEHTYNNANNGSILSVYATGTIVKLKI
ncbi:YbjQ family protein [Aliarcobacter butzleri]|uniref:YbjQ family protein n=1 Tax=Aliarcobacter butzleri TaxID=28197 RepID=UPI0027394600|nr:heavy metal-binding domain-containing protein [Aliarcobacter butzleri]